MVVFELGVLQVIGWFLASVMLCAAGWVVYGGQYRNPQHDRELAWLLWHWFTGGPLEPIHSYPGSGGRPRRAARRLGLAVARTALGVGIVAAVYVGSGAPYGTGLRTVASWAAGGVAAMAVSSVLIAWVAVEWSMFRHYVYPTHWAVAGPAGWDLTMRWWQILRYLRIPRGLAAGGGTVTVACGPSFKIGTDAEREVEKVVKAKLGLSDVSTGWKREGIHRYCEFVRLAPVPDKVPFKKVRELIEAESTDGKVLLGLTRGDDPVWLDLDKKAPHILISAGTGSGKTVALTNVTAQLMWHGAEIVVLDFKLLSHIWLRDLAGVRYEDEIDGIHRAAMWLGDEVDRRKRAWKGITLDDVEAGLSPTFPRLVVVCEEWSSTMDELRDHWKDIRTSGEPQRSPAVKALAKVLNMGRVLRMNVLMVAQRAEANAVGSGAMRENLPARILIDRYSKQTWDILAGGIEFRPGVSHAGRAQLCLGATATEIQMTLVTERQAQRWVIDKRGMQPRVPHPADTPSPGETVRDGADYGTRDLAGGVPAVTLWEAAKDTGRGVVDLNFEALKKQAQRWRPKGRFPEPVGKRGDWPTFDPRDLQRWETTKVRSRVIDGGDDIGGNEGDEVDRVDGIENESLAEDDSTGGWLQREPSRRDNDRDRFYAKVAPPNDHGCRLWTGAVNGDGYGYFKVAGKAVPAHRFAYEDQVAPIPPGHTIDHRVGPSEPCTSKLCMEGGHLQAVTNERNVELRHERDRQTQGAAT